MTINILTNVTAAPTTGSWYKDRFETNSLETIQSVLTGTGAITATVVVEGSNDGVHASTPPIATFSHSGSDSVAEGFVRNSTYEYIRARVTAISGTGATVNVIIAGSVREMFAV